MGNHTTAHKFVTGLVLVTVLVTTFLPNWASDAQASPSPLDETSPAAGVVVPSQNRAASATDATLPPGASSNTTLAPMNALVLSEVGRVDELEQTITSAGGYVYSREGDALYVGLNKLSYAELAPVGARAVYEGVVPGDDLLALSDQDRASVEVWNHVITNEPSDTMLNQVGSGLDTSVFFSSGEPAPADRNALALTTDQTSVFMVGSVSVDVVFVESSGDAENWTANEVSKAKAEVVDGLNWWTIAATAPDPSDPDAAPRPPAFLTWDIHYYSPFDGDTVAKDKVKVDGEPIQESIQNGQNGWMIQLAQQFIGGVGSPALLRSWADQIRNQRETDWGFVLFIVDSSNDEDGRFDGDGKAAGALIGGPWAVVTYDAGDLGINNLEIYIAQMAGHIFGAGSEAYDSNTDTGCHSNSNDPEYYGYLQVSHANCEYNTSVNIVDSLMRSGVNMTYAYRNYMLSNSARAQVGWQDLNENNTYDVIDTLFDTFDGMISTPVCPTLHISDIDVLNTAAIPQEFFNNGDENGWKSYVWDPVKRDYVDGIEYHKTNINRVGFVWGRINGGDWIEATPADGVAWDSENEGYNIILPGKADASNEIEIAIMNRWGELAWRSSNPTPISIPDVAGSGLIESNDPAGVELYFANGVAGGWSLSDHVNFSGGSTMTAGATGSEACFGFSGTEAIIYHSNQATGSATVYVDGSLHSTIQYANTGLTKVKHIISNLPSGKHTVSLIANTAGIDFDAFEVSDTLTPYLINATIGADISDPDGFYEDTGAKLRYAGKWATVSPFTTNATRQGSPDDSAHSSSTPKDRMYFSFVNADTVGIYRSVFPGGGSADVYLNGEFYGTMYNDTSSMTMVAPYYISGLSPAITYTVEVLINSGTPRMDIDAVRFMTLFGQTSPALYVVGADDPPLDITFSGVQEQYGIWDTKTTYTRSRDTGDVMTVFFQGSSIAVNRDTSGSSGFMELYIDGKLRRVVDNKDKKKAKDVAAVIHGLDASFPHVLQVRIMNDPPSKKRYNIIYGFTVSYAEPLTAGVYEEYNYTDGLPTDSAFIYEQDWKAPVSNINAYDGHFIESNHPDSRAYLYFTGVNTLTLYGVANTGYGQADIYINSELKGQFVLKGKRNFDVHFTLSDLDSKKLNILEIRVGSKRGMPAKIAIDRLVLYSRPALMGGEEYENTATKTEAGVGEIPFLQFSGQWTRIENDLASGSSYEQVGSAYDKLVFDVANATSVIIYRRLYSKYGPADVYVDGAYYTSFNNTLTESKTGTYQEPFTIAGLEQAFSHRIIIKPHVDAKGRYKPFDIDKVEVRKVEAAGISYLQDNYFENDDEDALDGQAIIYSGGPWTQSAPTALNPHSSTQAQSLITGARATVVFYGNIFTVYLNKGIKGGTVDLYIDGELISRYNTKSSTTVYDVPLSASGLENGMHTAEIILKSGASISIDGYRANTLVVDALKTTYNLVTDRAVAPQNKPLYVASGLWTVSGDYLQSREAGAALGFHTSGGDTAFLVRQALKGSGDIEVYVNGKLFTTAEASYLTKLGTPEEEYIVGGIHSMLEDDTWIEFRNKKAKLISIRQVNVGKLPTLGAGDDVEAEGPDVFPAGLWTMQPKKAQADYSGGFYMQSNSRNARFYIPVQNVSYVSVYRTVVGSSSDADVYIDGEFWGTMVNSSSRKQASVSYVIGPINEPGKYHVIELRPNHRSKDLFIDRVVCQGMTTLSPGYYENDDMVFTGIDPDTGLQVGPSSYFGKWTLIPTDAASGGTLHQARLRGDRLSAVFNGNQITIYHRGTTRTKYMMVYIDGNAYPISSRQRPTVDRIPFTVVLPEGGYHSLDLINSAGQFDFDAIEISDALPATFDYYQEDHPQVIVNNGLLWDRVASEEHSGGYQLVTTQKYASIFFLFKGQRVTTYMTKGKNWGRVNVYLDTELVETVDLYQYDPKNKTAPDEPFFAFDLTHLSAETHVLELRFEGAKTRGGKPRANFDVFSVDGAQIPRPGEDTPPGGKDIGGGDTGEILEVPTEGCYEESRTDDWIFSGKWDSYKGGAASPGPSYNVTFTYDAGNDVFAEFDFAAVGFSLIFRREPAGGQADIYLDGIYYTTLNMYWPTDQWLADSKLDYPGPSDEALDPEVRHVLRIVPVEGTPGSGVGVGRVSIDRLDLPTYDERYNPPWEEGGEGCYFYGE